MDDLRVKNIPSGLINPGLCLIMQMAGQELVINVDPSCQVSTVLARGCGVTMWMLYFFIYHLNEVNAAVTEVHLRDLKFIPMFFWEEQSVCSMKRPPTSCGKCVM